MIEEGNSGAVRSTLIKMNSLESRKTQNPVFKKSRTFVALDGTLSMVDLFNNAVKAVKLMFERAYQILDANYIDKSFLEIKFAIYRNYNSNKD